MENKLYAKDILVDIKSMAGFAKQLLGKGKEYELLLDHLFKKYYSNDDIPLPSLKVLQVELNISYTELHKQILGIYEDLLNYEENEIDFSINEVEYFFCQCNILKEV